VVPGIWQRRQDFSGSESDSCRSRLARSVRFLTLHPFNELTNVYHSKRVLWMPGLIILHLCSDISRSDLTRPTRYK
jgi:hypothetical protein